MEAALGSMNDRSPGADQSPAPGDLLVDDDDQPARTPAGARRLQNGRSAQRPSYP